MSKNNIDNLFKNLENTFDVDVPETGHETRFLNKLKNENKQPLKIVKTKTNFWKPFIGIAASIALIFSVFIFTSKTDNTTDLASISPEMAKTESLFTATLSKELENLDSEDMPEYQELIVDVLFQIKVLEEDYNQLIFGLKEEPNNELILSAMILNFQNRIDVLQDTKDKIEALKNSNNKVKLI
tara:strand:- start:588 stop:1139 length:552 start_codon:yes stop_codon:yes gene_type:complete